MPTDDSRRSFVQRFFDNFGKVPEEKPPIIPKPYRIPFFIALSVIALIALILWIQLVVVPGIRAHQATRGTSTPPVASSSK